MSRKTVILGATSNPTRYAYLAAHELAEHGHEIIPIGIKEGKVANTNIIVGRPFIEDVDTITLYLNANRQKEYYDYILKLRPKRIIFNPGTENEELKKLAEENGIEAENACTLVLLGTNQY